MVWMKKRAGRVGIAVWGLLPTLAIAASPPHDALRQEAQAYEQAGQWDKATEAYARLLAQDRQQPELHARLQNSVRRSHQARRHRDPVYRTNVLGLPVSQALDLYVEVLAKLNTQYADREKVSIERLYRSGLDEFRAALSEPTFLREQLNGVDPGAIAELADRLRSDAANRSIAAIRDARAAVRDLAWDAQRITGLNPTVAILEFACGASNGLDEYTLFLTPGQPLDDPAVLSGELAAYGVLLGWKDRQLVVDRVVPGSWAADYGLRPGDRITRVGKQALGQLLPDAVVELFRGDAATVAELTVLPAGSPVPRVLSLPGFIPSVQDDRIEREGIGYLRIANFQKTTLRELDAALSRLRSEGMRVLILDLRGNPGGAFAAAVQVADRFLPSGVIVSATGQVRAFAKTYLAQNPMTASDVPLVVLVDGDTASAAEVVAGALRDNDRALLVGQQTYGKGTIQKLLPLQAGSGLYLTLARLYGPRGQAVSGVGVAPHVVEPRRDGMKDFQFDVALEQATRLLAMH
ncbi:MAG TPA: S41 family peptidase [Gemmataceae bacterium]|nr:S41 family peptidase [Gemmataceae bacterium]